MELAFDNLSALQRAFAHIDSAMELASCGQSTIIVSVKKPKDQNGETAFGNYTGWMSTDGLMVEDGTDKFLCSDFEVAYLTVG